MYNTVYPLLKGVPESTGSVEPGTHIGKHVGDKRKRVKPSQGQLLLFTVLLTRAFDGRRWHRRGPWHCSTHSVLAESGAGVLAGFPGRKELSVCGRAASKVVA